MEVLSFVVSICLHDDGLGLTEMGQHIRMWDHICLPREHEYLKKWQGDFIFKFHNIIEFVNYQHGYFENLVHIKNGRCMPPTRPGFSTKLKDKCISR